MPRSIERVLAHLILPSLSKSYCLLSSRQATVQPDDNSISSLNVKHKSGAALWKRCTRSSTTPQLRRPHEPGPSTPVRSRLSGDANGAMILVEVFPFI